MNKHVQEAVQILKQGGIVIYPTDTAFGIGCRIDNPSAVERLFQLRRRPPVKATPVLAASLHMLEPFIKPLPQDVISKLIEPHWPGGLTIVLSCYPEKIPDLIRGGTETLGVRIPNHLVTLSMIEGVGVPIIGTSANFSGGKTPYTYEDLDPELIKLVDFVVPGECYAKQSSTVIDVTQHPWKVLREGAVKITV